MFHQNNSTLVELDRSNNVVEYTQFDVLQDENFEQYKVYTVRMNYLLNQGILKT